MRQKLLPEFLEVLFERLLSVGLVSHTIFETRLVFEFFTSIQATERVGGRRESRRAAGIPVLRSVEHSFVTAPTIYNLRQRVMLSPREKQLSQWSWPEDTSTDSTPEW